MGLNRMMMKKNGQSKQLYHLKSSYVHGIHVQVNGNDVPITVSGFCAEKTSTFGTTISPMGSLSPNEYCGAKIKSILMYPATVYNYIDKNIWLFGTVDFYGKLPENAIGEQGLLEFRIPQLDVRWVSLTSYNESTNITSCISDEDFFKLDDIGSLENLYLTIAPHVPPSDSK